MLGWLSLTAMYIAGLSGNSASSLSELLLLASVASICFLGLSVVGTALKALYGKPLSDKDSMNLTSSLKSETANRIPTSILTWIPKRSNSKRHASSGFIALGAFFFLYACSGAMFYKAAQPEPGMVIQQAPKHYWVVAAKRATPNAFKMCEVSGGCEEVRFCKEVPVALYAGYVVRYMAYIDHAGCRWINRADLKFKIVRQDDQEWKAAHGSLTWDDGIDRGRPVLWRGCFNTEDDKDTYCTIEPMG